MFYAFHDTLTPTLIGALATGVNAACNIASVYLLGDFGIFGIAASTVVSAAIQTMLSIRLLNTRYGIFLYWGAFGAFLLRYLAQLLCAIILFLAGWYGAVWVVTHVGDPTFFVDRWGVWFILVPLTGLVACFLFCTKKYFDVKLYFLR